MLRLFERVRKAGLWYRRPRIKTIPKVIDLNSADPEEVLDLEIPISGIKPFTQGFMAFDQYSKLPDWYSECLEANHGLVAYSEEAMRQILEDRELAFEYLTAENLRFRQEHAWNPGNEAVLIGGWVFPAKAARRCAFPVKNTKYEVFVTRGESAIAQLNYEVQGETAYFSSSVPEEVKA
jgi:hypothetical protein